MKKYFCIFLLLIFFNTQYTVAQQPPLEQQLISMDLNLFLNKPIDTLLAYLPHTDSIFVTSTEPIYRGAGLIIEYYQTPFLWLYINIYEPQHITAFSHNYLNPENAWPVSLVKKEKIGRILIYKDSNTLINQASLP